MATYSINIGTPTESTKVQDLQTFLNKLPDNTAQLISPRDTRDSIFTTWENILIKETSVASSPIGYIGLDNASLKAAMLIGKKAYTTQEILDNTLLSSDTDLFIFNGKSDSNPSLQDTKVSFLAGLIPSDYYYAPYIEANKITLPSRIDLSIVNPATAGVININADQIELGNNGWVINNAGALYPIIDGQDLGATPSNRIGNLYMSSRIDYANNLIWTVGNTTNMSLTTTGTLSVSTLNVDNIYTNNLQITTSATAGYVLSSDGIGNAIWQPTSIVAPGVTAGYIIVADGVGNTIWQQNAASGSGLDGSVQFSQTGILSSDNTNFYWDNINKKFGIKTNTPSTELEVVGSGSFSNSLTVGLTTSTSTLNTDYLNINQNFIFATAGFGLGKLLTSDTLGNVTWQNAPITVTASGPINMIQLSDGIGNFTHDLDLKWDNSIGNILKISSNINIIEPHGNGLQTSGNILFENDSFIGWNTYWNGTQYKRISNNYSSWVGQETNGLFKISVAPTGITASIITASSSILIDNNNGNVGLDITPVRKLHINDTMRLEGRILAPTASIANGDIYYDTTLNDLIVHDNTNWYKTLNKSIIQVEAYNMFDQKNVNPPLVDNVFNGVVTDRSKKFMLYGRWRLREFRKTRNMNAIFNFVLPDNYIPGRDIKVRLNYTFNGYFPPLGSIKWMVGLVTTSPGLLNSYSNDLDTQYLTNIISIQPSTYIWRDFKTEYIFSGLNYKVGSKLSIIIIRLALADTYTLSTYISTAEVSMI